jgi:hypothetical protein
VGTILSSLVLSVLQAASCHASPTEDLPFMGSAVGASPVWVVDGASQWDWKQNEPFKTLWVLLRTSQELRIKGRRLDAPGVLKFVNVGDRPIEELVVDDPARRSVRPGGAQPEIMRTYAFLPSLVIYPSAGCWEFTVRIGDAEHRIVLELKPRQ